MNSVRKMKFVELWDLRGLGSNMTVTDVRKIGGGVIKGTVA